VVDPPEEERREVNLLSTATIAICILPWAAFCGWCLYRAGRKKVELEHVQAARAAARAKKEVVDEVDTLGPADVDRRLSQWMRD
jgi:type VI protein secretion system component VasK